MGGRSPYRQVACGPQKLGEILGTGRPIGQQERSTAVSRIETEDTVISNNYCAAFQSQTNVNRFAERLLQTVNTRLKVTLLALSITAIKTTASPAGKRNFRTVRKFDTACIQIEVYQCLFGTHTMHRQRRFQNRFSG